MTRSLFKLLCGIGVVIAAGALGCLESWRLKSRVTQLRSLLSFFNGLEAEIEFTGSPIGQIIRAHKDDLLLLAACCDSMEDGRDFAESWHRAVLKTADGLKKQDVECLLQFGEGFGKTDKTGQVAGCRMTIRRLEELLANAKEDVAKKSKLYCSLGILCGAGIFCIFV